MDVNIKTIIKSDNIESRLQTAIFMIRTLHEQLEKSKKEKKEFSINSRKSMKHGFYGCYICNQWNHYSIISYFSCKNCKVNVCYNCVKDNKDFNLYWNDQMNKNFRYNEICDDCYSSNNKK